MAANIRNSEKKRWLDARGHRRLSVVSIALLMSLALIIVFNTIAPTFPFSLNFLTKVRAAEAPEVITSSYITADGETYNIKVSYGLDARIPAGASLKVGEILPDSAEYAGYLAKAESEINSNIPYMRFFDISILNGNGEEIQPAAPVSVEIALDDQVTATEGVEFTAVHIDGADVDVIPVEVDEKVSFSAEGFSVYGVGYTYTVDFRYGEAEAHMPGGSEMLLSELLAQLGIEQSAADVVSVNYTDPSQLSFTQAEGNWTITSLKPFTTEEELTLTFADGTVVEIRVKDDQREAGYLKFRVFLTDVDTNVALPNVQVQFTKNGSNISSPITTGSDGSALLRVKWSDIGVQQNLFDQNRFFFNLSPASSGYSIQSRTFVGGEWTIVNTTETVEYISTHGVKFGTSGYSAGGYAEFTALVITPTPKNVTFITTEIDNISAVFDSSYQDVTNGKQITVTYNTTTADPANNATPIKANNTNYEYFKYWSTTQNGTAFDFNTPITSNVTLYPVWGSTYSVTFDTSEISNVNASGWDWTGYSNVTNGKQKRVNEGATITDPVNGVTPEKLNPAPDDQNTAFLGWTTTQGSSTPYVFGTAVTSNITLYPIWGLPVQGTITIVVRLWDHDTYWNKLHYNNIDWLNYHPNTNQHVDASHPAQLTGANSEVYGLKFEVVTYPKNDSSNRTHLCFVECDNNSNTATITLNAAQLQLLHEDYVIDIDPVYTDRAKYYDAHISQWIWTNFDWDWITEGGSTSSYTHAGQGRSGVTGVRVIPNNTLVNIDQGTNDNDVAWIANQAMLNNIRNNGFSYTWNLWVTPAMDVYFDEDRGTPDYPDVHFPPVNSITGQQSSYYVSNPGTCTRDPGEYFVGWYEVILDADGNEASVSSTPFNFNKPITHTTYLKAKYAARLYRLHWMNENCTTEYEQDIVAPEDYPVFDANTPTKADPGDGTEYVFVGWSLRHYGDTEYKKDYDPDYYYVDNNVVHQGVFPQVGNENWVHIDTHPGENSPYYDVYYHAVFTRQLKTLPVTLQKNDAAGQSLSGIEFRLQESGASTYTTVITGADGSVSLGDLEYTKTYTLTEVLPGNSPYQTVSPITFTIAANGTLSVTSGTAAVSGNATDGYTLTVVNSPKPVNVQVKKVDGNGALLPGATFTLTNNGTLTDSDNDGLFDIVSLGYGTYTLTETNAPTNYVGVGEAGTITINADGSVTFTSNNGDKATGAWNDAHTTFIITIKNEIGTVPVILEKVDEDGTTHMGGVKFTLNGTEYTTGSNGTVSLGSLTYGSTYTLIETADWTGSNNYILPGNITVNVSSTGVVTATAGNSSEQSRITVTDNNGTYNIKIKNVKKSVQVRIQKLDADTNQPITTSSATFSLGGSEKSTSGNSALTDVWTLYDGEYTLAEIVAPDGYDAAANIPNVNVSFGQNSVTVTCGSYTVTEDNGVYTIEVENTRKTAPVTLERIDESDSVKLSATFTVSPAPEGTTGTFTTDATTGQISLGYLKYGTIYTVTETVAPARYNALNGSFTIKINDDGTMTITKHNGDNVTKSGNSADGFVVTVADTLTTAALTITKIIIDDSVYPSGIVYNNITFTVKDSANHSWTATNNGDGTWTVADLPLGEYTVTETVTVPSGYTSVTTVNGTDTTNVVVNSRQITVDGTVTVGANGGSITFTNTYTRHRGTLIIHKIVKGEQVMPDTAKFTLTDGPYSELKGVYRYYSQFVTVDGQTYKEYVFENMPTGSYSVGETDSIVPGYSLTTVWTGGSSDTSTGRGNVTLGEETVLTCTNTYSRIMIDVTVTKIWNDGDNQDGIRPEELTLTLNNVPGGFTVPTPTVAKNGNEWTYTWSGVPEYDNNGNKITYTVTEGTVPQGYECNSTMPVAAGGVIYNSHSPAKINISVTKVWSDSNNQYNTRPDTITFRLQKKNGNAWETVDSIILTVADASSCTFENLPKYAAGVEIEYQVIEVEVDGYATEVTGTMADGFTVTNTLKTITVKLVKVDGANNKLEGVGFTLTDGTTTLYTDANGEIDLGSFAWGSTFTLTEVAPPDGYLGIAAMTFEVKAANGELTQTTNVSVATITGDATNGYTITVVNTAGVELPATGGIGTVPFIAIGLSLMAFAAAMLVWVRKKETA